MRRTRNSKFLNGLYSLDDVDDLNSTEEIKAYLECLGTDIVDEDDEMLLVSGLRSAHVAKGLLQLAFDVGIDKDALHQMFKRRKMSDHVGVMHRIASVLGVPYPGLNSEDESKIVEGFWDKMCLNAMRQIVSDTGIDRNVFIGMFGSFLLPKQIPDVVPKVLASLSAPVRKPC
jgi:DNA-binding phage protein